jgi:DNA-binding SARP family transcriptional activator
LLEIRTLGGLSVLHQGEPVTGFASRKVEALLVYLACIGRPKAREVLAELLWEERTQSRSLSNLRVALSSLRKRAGPYFIITRETVSVNPDAEVWVDIAAMEQHLTGAREPTARRSVDQIEEAVALYQGDFLEGFYVRGSEGFDNWMLLERERIRVVYEQTLQLFLDALLAEERWPDAIEWGERWVSQGQIPEPAYRALMNAYSGLGDRASVSAVYHRCVQALERELGVEPSDQTRETYDRLLRGEQPLVAFPVQAIEPEAPAADSAARLLLRQWRGRGADVVDVASLAVIYASRGDLGLGPDEAGLLIRSALHHGVDVEPWLRRAGSPEAAVQALDGVLERYPRPRVRMQVVEALKGLPGDAAADSLTRVALTDDAPNVRTEAALAAASKGRLHAVTTGLIAELETGNEAAPLSALVALEDEFGLPEDAGPYPRFPVVAALTQRRWQAQRGNIMRQTVRAGLGGALALALFAMGTPLYYALAFPEEFGEIAENLVTLPAWMLSSALMGVVIGGILGMASGFSVGLADALWKGGSRGRWRLLVGSLAGLVHSAYLILFSLIGAFLPSASSSVFIPADIVYGLVQGLIAALVIPPIGSFASFRQQLLRSLSAGLASVLVTVPYVYVVYVGEASSSMFSRLLSAFVLVFGLGMALSSRTRKGVQSSAKSGVSVSQ